MIKFFLIINRHGQTRYVKYFENFSQEKRNVFEQKLIRNCLQKKYDQSCVFLIENQQVVFWRYASLYLIIGIDQNESSFMQTHILIHKFVTILDQYFGNVSELEIMLNIDKVFYIAEEMFCGGMVVETNEKIIQGPVLVMNNIN